MPCLFPEHHQSSGGGGGLSGPLGALGVFVLAAVLVKFVLIPAVHVALDVLQFVLVALAVAVGAAAIAGVVFAVVRVHRRGGVFVRSRAVISAPAAEVLTGHVRSAGAVTGADTDRVAIGGNDRPEVHNHFHVHLGGTSAEADAAAVRALTERNG